MRIRPRTDADQQDCEQLARIVHDLDGYPPYLPGGDLRTFIRTGAALAAWVAERDDQLVGHVALNETSSAAVMSVAANATGRSPETLAVVVRLLVSPQVRRRGVGAALLSTAAAAALSVGRWPVLDVATRFRAAVALCEASGWTRAGAVTVSFPTVVGQGRTGASWPRLGHRDAGYLRPPIPDEEDRSRQAVEEVLGASVGVAASGNRP